MPANPPTIYTPPSAAHTPPGAVHSPPVVGGGSPQITGTMTPVVTGPLIEVSVPKATAFPGTRQWSTDGNAIKNPTGAWVEVYTAFMQTAAAATVEQIAPKAGYSATGSQSTAPTLQFFTPGVGWVLYWLYDNSGNPRWVDAADAGNADAGSTVIASGTWAFAVTTNGNYSPFVGGLGAAWRADPSTSFIHFLLSYFNNSGNGTWISFGPSAAGSYSQYLTSPVTGSPVFSLGSLPTPPAIVTGPPSASPASPGSIHAVPSRTPATPPVITP